MAYRRFSDYFPQLVYDEFAHDIRGGMETAIYDTVNLTGPDVVQRCVQYLEEDPETCLRRERLHDRSIRVSKAQDALRRLWVAIG